MDKVTKKIFSYFLIIFSILSYFIGFYLNENSAGAGSLVFGDLKNTWNNLNTFLNNSILDGIHLTTSLDTDVYKSSRTPLIYIIHKIFNPFTDSVMSFRISVFIFSLLIPILFFLNLRKKYKDADIVILMLISSIVLLSPYLRTSAFWGGEENFGIITTLLSFLFLQLLFETDNIFKEKIYLLSVILFSSLCVYFDHKLLLIPIICFFSIYFSGKFSFRILSILLYFICSLPFLYLIKLWGHIIPTGDAASRLSNDFYLHHVGYSVTILAFYLLPLVFFKKNPIRDSFNKFLKNKNNIFFLLFFLIYIFYLIFFYKYENEITLGKGFFYKIAIFLFNSLTFQKIFLFIGFYICWVIILFIKDKKIINNFIIFYFLIIPIFFWPLLQEYFDPIIFLLIFTFCRFDIKINYNNVFFLFFYFGIFLAACNVYYYNLLN